MTDPLPSLDLRLTPDWLKESEPGNRYADYDGDDSAGPSSPRAARPPGRSPQASKPCQTTGPGGHNLIADRPPTTSPLSLQPNVAPKAAARSRPGTTGRVFNAGKSQPFGRRPSRLRCRSIFFRKNGRFPKSFSRSNKGTLPIRCSVWHACFWSVPSAIGSAFVRWTITR